MIHSITGHKAKLLHTNNIDNLLLTIMYSAINCDLTVVSFGKEYKGGSIFRLLDYCLFLPYSESYLIKKHFFDFYMILICLFVKSWGRGRSDLDHQGRERQSSGVFDLRKSGSSLSIVAAPSRRYHRKNGGLNNFCIFLKFPKFFFVFYLLSVVNTCH